MPTLTSNFGLLKPLVNNATDQDLWGGQLNTDMDDIDGLLETAINFITSAQTSSFSVIAPTTGTTTTGSASTLYLCNATSGNIIPSLPSASSAGNGFTVGFKKTDSSANIVTITAAGADTIDGAGTLVITSQYADVIVISDGISQWNINGVNPSNAAPINSPAFTGTPTAPTASSGTTTTQLATTDFVTTAVTAGKIMTALGIGSIIFAENNSGSTISVSGTIAGTNLIVVVGSAPPTGTIQVGHDSLSGTWQALQTMNNGDVGLWQRTV